MTETPNSSDQPNIPNNPSEIFEDLHDRDKQRKHAVDIARQNADAATTEEEKAYWANVAAVMSDVRFELHELFPEVFDD